MKELNSGFVETVSLHRDVKFAGGNNVTIEIGEDTYTEVAKSLIGAIGGACYFNGSIDTDCCGFYSTLSATVIVYREEETLAGERASTIGDIVPVWWEFSTVVPFRGEVMNDFSFSKLKDAVMVQR